MKLQNIIFFLVRDKMYKDSDKLRIFLDVIQLAYELF